MNKIYILKWRRYLRSNYRETFTQISDAFQVILERNGFRKLSKNTKSEAYNFLPNKKLLTMEIKWVLETSLFADCDVIMLMS